MKAESAWCRKPLPVLILLLVTVLFVGCASTPKPAAPAPQESSAGPQAAQGLPKEIVDVAHANIGFVYQTFKKSPRDYEAVYNKAWDLLQQGEISKAREFAQDAVGTIDSSVSFVLPVVEEGVLYAYGFGWEEGEFPYAERDDWSLPTILDRLAPADADALSKRLNPRIMELWGKSPWKKVSFVYPVIPRLYYILGYTAVEARDAGAARDYLDRALELWPDDLMTWSEREYVEAMTRDYREARRIAQDSLGQYVAPSADRASVYRQLGYLASEELAYDQAVAYYRSALDNQPGDTVSPKQIEYVQSTSGYGTIEAGGLYRHAASKTGFPARAGDFERVGVAYPDAQSVDVRYRITSLPLDIWVDVRATPRSLPLKDAANALLDGLKKDFPDLEVLFDWEEEPTSANGPSLLHLAAASRASSSHLQVWVEEAGSWQMSWIASYAAPAALILAQKGGLQVGLGRFVRAFGPGTAGQATTDAQQGAGPAESPETTAEARNTFRTAVRTLSGREDYYLLSLASVDMDFGKKDDAERLVSRAIGANAKNPEAWVLRGEMLEYDGKNAEALTAYSRAIELGTWWPGVQQRRGWVRYRTGDIGGAVADLEAALAKSPDDPEILNNLAWYLIQTGDLTRAHERADRAVALNPSASYIDTRAWIHYHAGRLDEALADARQAVELDPWITSSRVLLYRITTDRGDGARAKAELRAYLQSTAQAPEDARLLSAVRWLLGELPLADLRKDPDWVDIKMMLRGMPGIT